MKIIHKRKEWEWVNWFITYDYFNYNYMKSVFFALNFYFIILIFKFWTEYTPRYWDQPIISLNVINLYINKNRIIIKVIDLFILHK